MTSVIVIFWFSSMLRMLVFQHAKRNYILPIQNYLLSFITYVPCAAFRARTHAHNKDTNHAHSFVIY